MDKAQDGHPEGYRVLTHDDIPAYIAGVPAIVAQLGGGPADWTVRDVADGNLNAVYLVDGPAGGVCVKQALPYVRVHHDWPLAVERALFEHAYMVRLDPFVGRGAPQLYHFDPTLFTIVMEKLEPHIILRKGLIEGRHLPKAAPDTATFIANATFNTSDLAAPFERKFEDIAHFARNQALLRITMDLVLTDPYREVWRNRYVRPHMEGWAAAFRTDVELKTAVARQRMGFLTNTQALIHGDLHSGSVMVTEDDTRVIDGEFASYGPIGLDTGAFIANLIMSWYAHGAYDRPEADRRAYRDWILEQIAIFWATFRDRFLTLWENATEAGDAYPADYFTDTAGKARLATIRRDYLDRIFADTVAFAALKMNRRIIGYAQIADYLVIEDLERRARAQAPALALARALLTRPERFADIAAVLDAIPRFERAGLDPDAARHL